MSGVGWEAREGRVGAPASSTGSRRGANWSVESERGLQDRYDRGRNVLLSVMSRVKQSAAVLALLTGQLIGRRRWGQLNGGWRSVGFRRRVERRFNKSWLGIFASAEHESLAGCSRLKTILMLTIRGRRTNSKALATETRQEKRSHGWIW